MRNSQQTRIAVVHCPWLNFYTCNAKGNSPSQIVFFITHQLSTESVQTTSMILYYVSIANESKWNAILPLHYLGYLLDVFIHPTRYSQKNERSIHLLLNYFSWVQHSLIWKIQMIWIELVDSKICKYQEYFQNILQVNQSNAKIRK